MAEDKIEIRPLIDVNTGEAITSIQQLRSYIKDLKQDLEKLTIGEEDYNKTSQDLYEAQTRMADVMRATKKPVNEVEGSMNQLQETLRKLKEEWKNLAPDSDRFKEVNQQVIDTKNKINALNEGIGNFQHNVGNYEQSIIDAFNKMGLSVKGLSAIMGRLGIDTGDTSKVMSGLLMIFKQFSPAIKTLSTSMKGVETATAGATTAMKGLKAAIASTGIGLLVVAVSTLIANWDKLIAVFKKAEDTTEDLNKALEMFLNNISYENKEIEYNVQMMQAQGKTQKEVDEYRIQATENIVNETYAIWQETKAIKASAEAKGIDAEKSKELAEAVKKAEEAYLAADSAWVNALKQKDIHDTLKKTKEEEDAITNAVNRRKDAEREHAKTLEERAKIVEQVNEAWENAEKEGLAEAEKVRAEAEEGLKSEEQKEMESYQRRLALLLQYGQDTTALEEEHARNLANFRQEKAEEAIAQMISELDGQEEIRAKYAERDISKAEDEGGGWNAEELAEKYDADYEAYKTYIEQKIELNQRLQEEYEIGSERWMEIQRENDALSEELLDADEKRLEKKGKAYKKLMQVRQEATKSMVNSSSDLFKALSLAMGESTKMGKGFAIAAATIDTIASAVSGYRAGMNQWAEAGSMAWMGPVQGALNATIALITGYAQVQKIQSVDTSGNASASGGSATAIAVPDISGLSTPFEYTRDVTTQTEKEEMNKEQRVYILESDIQESNRRVSVRENDTTF